MVQVLEDETDVMVQFLAPEIVIIGERNYILFQISTQQNKIIKFPSDLKKLKFSSN